MGYGTVEGCRGNLRRVLPQARLVGAQEGLLAAGHLQLAHDVRHVVRDRLRAERQSLRDLGVGDFPAIRCRSSCSRVLGVGKASCGAAGRAGYLVLLLP